MIALEAEREDSEGDVDIGGDTESMSIYDRDGSENNDFEIRSSSSGGSDGGHGGGKDIEMPQVGDAPATKGGGEEESEDEKVLRARIRSLDDLVATLQHCWIDDREHFRRAYGAFEAERDQTTGERDRAIADRDRLQQERDDTMQREWVIMDAND